MEKYFSEARVHAQTLARRPRSPSGRLRFRTDARTENSFLAPISSELLTRASKLIVYSATKSATTMTRAGDASRLRLKIAVSLLAT